LPWALLSILIVYYRQNPTMLTSNLYSYKGSINGKIVDTLLADVKRILLSEISDKQMFRKAYGVCVECVENMNRHEEIICADFSEDNSLSINKQNGTLLLTTQNWVNEEVKDKLEKSLAELRLSKHECIKQLRLDQLKHGKFSDKGGANIGMLDVFLNAHSISYEFEENKKGFFYYKLKAELTI